MSTGNRKAAGLASAFSSRLNEEIRVWMTRRGENLRTLEESTGISRSRLSRTINRDEAPINTNELELICKALNISPSEIIGIAERAVRASIPHHAVRHAPEPGGHYNTAGEWVPATRDGYTLAAYESAEEKGVDYIDG